MTDLKTIHTHFSEIKSVSLRLNNSHYVGMKNGNSYFTLDGKFYEEWQSGCGNYVTEIDKLPNF